MHYVWQSIKTSFLQCITHITGDKTYDAFVSFKAGGEDEDFVMMQLYPRLEADMGYKLCIHQRDFLVGESTFT